jgi:predicted nucleic acid-binding protein
MLLIDTNILVRVSQGRAMVRVEALQSRAVRLATTDRNADELEAKLVEVFGWDGEAAREEVDRVLDGIEIIPARDYEHGRRAADQRLHQVGKSDWPALAAALTLEGEIWSDDVDFFGVGVPVWSTHNVRFVEAKAPA